MKLLFMKITPTDYELNNCIKVELTSQKHENHRN